MSISDSPTETEVTFLTLSHVRRLFFLMWPLLTFLLLHNVFLASKHILRKVKALLGIRQNPEKCEGFRVEPKNHMRH